MCFGQDYGGALGFLAFSHALNSFRFIVQTMNILMVPLIPALNFKLYFFEKVLEFVGLVIQLLAILYAQDVYYFTNLNFEREQCSFHDFGFTFYWLRMEIMLFYSNLITNFFFILLSETFLRGTGLIYPEKNGTKSDFLMKYRTMLGLFQTFSMLLFCTAFAIYTTAEQHRKNYFPADADLFIVFLLLSIALCVHIFQFLAVLMQLFCSQRSRGRNESLLVVAQIIGMVIVPILLVIGQVIWLSVLSDMHLNQLYFNWTLCDVILSSLGTILYLIQLERI